METIVINDEEIPQLEPQSQNRGENTGSQRELHPTFATSQSSPMSRTNKKCIIRGHIFGVLFPLQSNFNFFASGVIHSLTLFSIMLSFLTYDSSSTESSIFWDFIFITRIIFQIMRLIDSVSLSAIGRLDKTGFRIFHYLILGIFQTFFYIGYKTKNSSFGFVAVLDFAYVLIINFFGAENVNRYESTLNEIVMLSVFTSLFSEAENKSWSVSLLMVTISCVVAFLLLTVIACQMHKPKQLAVFSVFYLNIIALIVMVYSLNSFEKDSSNWYLVTPAPFLTWISYVIVKLVIWKRYKSPKYLRITFSFTQFEANNVEEAVRLTRMRMRGNNVSNQRRSRRANFNPEESVRKKKEGAADRMAGFIMTGPSLFRRLGSMVEGEDDDKEEKIRSKIEEVKKEPTRKKVKKKKITIQKEEIPKVKKGGEEEEEDICFICYAEKPNTFYDPCSHAGVCKTCALSIMKDNKTCPICRGKLKALIFYEKTADGKYREIESLDLPKEESQVNIFVGVDRSRNMDRTRGERNRRI